MSHESVNALGYALLYQHLGYACLPIMPGKKQPAMKWKEFQIGDRTLSERELWQWFHRTEHNIAIVSTGLVVVDCDSPDLLDSVLRHCGQTPMICRTPRGGFHLYYRARRNVKLGNRVRINGLPLDIRTTGGYAVAPPSKNQDGVSYSWFGDLAAPHKLPVFKFGWLRQRKRTSTRRTNEIDSCPDRHILRAEAYLARVEGAVSGQRGHDATFRVACILIRRFGLSIGEAWPLFCAWNQKCRPPWSEDELRHKLYDAAKS